MNIIEDEAIPKKEEKSGKSEEPKKRRETEVSKSGDWLITIPRYLCPYRNTGPADTFYCTMRPHNRCEIEVCPLLDPSINLLDLV